jgi:hypothetical protein
MADVGDKVNGEGSEKGNGDSNDKKWDMGSEILLMCTLLKVRIHSRPKIHLNSNVTYGVPDTDMNKLFISHRLFCNDTFASEQY